MPLANMKVRIFLEDAEGLGLKDGLLLEMPTVDALEFSLIDFDEQVCRIIDENELRPMYVDNEIDFIAPLQPDPWTLSPDHIDMQKLRITYTDGRTLGFRLGDIDTEPGIATRQFSKREGIAFPVDDENHFSMNATNTPFLSAVRRNIHKQLGEAAAERLELAAIVAVFANILSANSDLPPPF